MAFPTHQIVMVNKVRTFKMKYLILAEFHHKNKKWKWSFNQSKLLNGLFVKQRKPFTNGELIKLCLIAAAKCSEKIYLLD